MDQMKNLFRINSLEREAQKKGEERFPHVPERVIQRLKDSSSSIIDLCSSPASQWLQRFFLIAGEEVTEIYFPKELRAGLHFPKN